MRFWRLILGALLIVGALWVIIGEQMTGASANAVVNARLSTLRAPVAGELTMPYRSFGTAVVEGEELASVTDPLTDRIRLNDLLMERDFQRAANLRAAANIRETETVMAHLAERYETYTAARLAEIALRLDHARERLRLLEAGLGDDGLLEDLLSDGQDVDRGDLRVPGIALEHARERVGVLEIALRAAEAGVFLGDGYNDAPNAEQRRVELETVLAGHRAELAEGEERLAAIERRLTEERLAVNRLTGGPILSTVNGQLWEVLADDGERVERGQDVLRLVDCDQVIVTLSVAENVYNSLSVGDPARFRLSGDRRSFEGTILRLAGSGAATIYRNLAVAPSEAHLERYDVALLVPALRTEPDLRCRIGQTGRAFFERRPLDWLRDLFR